MNDDRNLEQLLRAMKQTTTAIWELDLQKEANDPLLLSLQSKQILLRAQIERSIGEQRQAYSELERQLLTDCLAMEEEISVVLKSIHRDADQHLQRFTEGRRTRHAYHNDYVQAAGVFIDRQH